MVRKLLITTAATMGILSAAAQQNFEIGNPKDEANYGYLRDFGPLKQYIDRQRYPNFRLGIGTTVNDYLQKGTVYKLTNTNFDETVAGNAMKMASCVNGSGVMDFSNVTRYVNAATAAGLSVYGHTLAWHSQQPTGWLNSLIKDRPAPETDGDTEVHVNIAQKNFGTQQTVGWNSDTGKYGYSLSFDATNGLRVHTTKVNPNSYDVQYVAMADIPTERGKTYYMTITLRGSKSGRLHTKLGDWGSGPYLDVPFTTEWQDVTVKYSPAIDNSFLLLQNGDFVGDIYIRNITISQIVKGNTINEERGCLKVQATERHENVYDNQFWIVTGAFPANCTYEFSAEVRADVAAKASTQIHNAPTSYVHHEALGDIPFTTEWTTVRKTGRLSQAGQSIAFNLNELAEANTYYLDNISFKINGVERVKNGTLEGEDVSSYAVKVYGGGAVKPVVTRQISYLQLPSSIPLTPQEKHDTLVYAMDKWISGMMKACGGKVKAWDVVNEAISGGNADSQGVFALQHDNGSGDFFWQDHMGDLEYVRQAIRLARKYGPSDIKLFINDYNLESDWDNNGKLRSLIAWIKRWEADGVTKVDGIGSQMHISCYMNESTQNSKKRHIEQMLTLMAATGKWVRISELDMGMVDASGKDVPTSKMTEAMHKRMADLYEWIVKKYLEIVPVDQQWGICQWCPTDSPANSGWRADTPVGIWTLNTFYRKHVYAGYVRGLGGVLQSLDQVELDEASPLVPADGIIYDLNGRRLSAGTTFEALPAGLYIINGKRVMR